MKTQTIFDRAALIISLLLFAAAMSGTNACQEDYFFASDNNLGSPTPTESDESPTPTEDPDETEDDDVEIETPTPTATEEEDEEDEEEASGVIVALRSLSEENNPDPADSDVIANGVAAASKKRVGKDATWLGKSYEDKEEVKGDSLDSDGDGYTDLLEIDSGSDPHDELSIPTAPVSFLSSRFAGVDDDYDGLSNEDERKEGTDPDRADSDSDGVLDGIEILCDTDPRDAESKPRDTDGDGLSNSYESEIGTSPNSRDTDGDGLADHLEIIVSSNPLHNDSDGDGILDGTEVQQGADPTIAER